MDRTVAALVGVVVLVLVGGFVTLALTRNATDAYALFVSGPIVTGLVGIALSRKVGAVQSIAEDVRTATNGVLSGRLDSVDTALRDAEMHRATIALRPADGSPVIPGTRQG